MPPFDLPELLRAAGFAHAAATPIHSGWASWAFDLNGQTILRVASSSDIAATHRKEARLLPQLAAHVGFHVPLPTLGEHNGFVYMTYPKLPGRPFAAQDNIKVLAETLRQLHSFPVDRAAELTGSTASGQAWQQDYLAMWTWVERDVLPILDGRLAAKVRDEYSTALEWLPHIAPALVHRDLGREHILCDSTGRPTGIIDFEDATVGDPAIDFIGILNGLGMPHCRALISAYGTEFPEPHLRFYYWLGSVHAIAYGLSIADRQVIADGVHGLRSRLET